MSDSCATGASKILRPEPVGDLRARLARSIATLRERAGRALPLVCLGYSGGLDSSVLLALLADARDAHACELRAVHVHHGLSPNASDWADHCARRCEELRVPLEVRRVEVTRAGGESLEEQARNRRRAVLRSISCDVIALAHHADDQVETVLLQLLRGAGPKGLAAMAEWHEPAKPHSGSWVWRPLLTTTRQELADFAAVESLEWVEDESNAGLQATRNVLRHAVVPAIAERFPAMHGALARASRLQAEAANLLEDLAGIDLAALACGTRMLDCERLQCLSEARIANVLRYWIASAGVRAPSAARLAALVSAVRRSTNDTRLSWRHEGLLVARRRGMLVLEDSGGADVGA